MIGQFILAFLLCVTLLTLIHYMDRAEQANLPTRKQRKQWAKERADLNPALRRRP